MKRFLLSALAIFIFWGANAQITITSSDNVLLLNGSINYKKLFDVDETFDVGEAGENVIWDFSLQGESGENELYEYLDPTGKPHVDEMPSVDLAERLNGDNNGFFYFDNNGGTEWNRSGTYVLTTGSSGTTIMWWHYEIASSPAPLQLVPYPFTYNTDLIVDPFGGHGGYDMSGTQDELVIPNDGSYHFECDGYGMLKLPHKIYPNALRVHVTEEFTINLLMGGTPVVSMDISDDAYYWYVEGVKGPVMSYVASTTSTGKDITYNAKWYREDLTAIQTDFVADATTGNTDYIFTFTNLSEPLNQGSTFLWEFTPNTVTFEDGTDATSAHPKVKFTDAGTYTVALTTTNSNFTPDAVTETKTDYIEIDAAPQLVVDFSASTTTPALNGAVDFTSNITVSTGDPLSGTTTYQWAVSPGVNGTHWGFTNFTSETDENPQITFYQSGCYSVQLIATNGTYSNSPVTETKMNYINAAGGCGDSYTVTFTVTDGTTPINGAEITVTGYSSIVTNASGEATISLMDGNYNYNVTATGYDNYSGSFTVNGANLPVPVSMTPNSVNKINSDIKIYPNPTSGIFTVKLKENSNISVIDIQGREIFTENDTKNTIIDLSSYSKGIYFLKISNNKSIITEKIILK